MGNSNYSLEYNSTSRYIKSLDKKILTKEEERNKLMEINAATDKEKEQLKKEFAEHNLRLVITIASSYTKDSDLLLDLIQQGNIGLLLAIDKFNIEKDTKFSSYAVFWINKEIITYLRENRLIQLPNHLYPQIREYNSAKKKLSNFLKREVTDVDISKFLGWSIEKTESIAIFTNNISSLNERLIDDDEKELIDFIPSDISVEDTLMKKNMINDIRNLIDSEILKPREKEVLLYRYGFYTDKEMSREKIGEILDIGRETIRQDEVKALKKLKTIAKKKGYNDYLN